MMRYYTRRNATIKAILDFLGLLGIFAMMYLFLIIVIVAFG